MMSSGLIKGETKATSQHQVTIPKPIWDRLKLKEGARFTAILTEDQYIVLEPQAGDLEMTDEEWKRLLTLAHSPQNVSKKFKSTRQAIRYLDKL